MSDQSKAKPSGARTNEARGDVPAHLTPTLAAPPAQDEVAALGEMRPRADSFAPGMLIAEKYAIERVLGEGGIGIVVAARHVELDQTVAIKYLRPSLLNGSVAADRFLREARLAAKIRSDHVIRVYDVGRLPDGSPYMVMEYLAGTDLGRLLVANGPLPLERAIDYILQTCEALAEAHVAGIVHRDLKPDNLFVSTAAGEKSILKILDFGISKLSVKRTTSDRVDVLTKADDKFGTPVYMSPEQLRASRDVDARADIWAVGVVLYELLTGSLPFDGAGLPELCTAILTMPPVPLIQHRPYLPVALQAVIERCLAKEPDGRFRNVAELAQELLPFADAAGAARIDHIVNVIRAAGEPIRPPTPVPGDATSRLLGQAVDLHGADPRQVVTNSPTTTTTTPSVPIGATKGSLSKQLMVAVAGAVLAVIGIVAFVRLGYSGTKESSKEPRARAAGGAHAEVALVAEPSTSAAAVAAPAPTEAPPVDGAATVTASVATSARAIPPIPSAPLGVRPPPVQSAAPPPTVSAAATPAQKPPAAVDTSGVINPFE